MPLYYNELEPLSSSRYRSYSRRSVERSVIFATAHTAPLVVDEFPAAQRCYPIVFSTGADPVPMALMGLHQGVNVFVDDAGRTIGDAYVPAYVRRYPFMLARLHPGASELSLCFDPSSGLVGEYADGEPLFDADGPSAVTREILRFCEEFEMSAQRTGQFMQELQASKLLIDGEVSIRSSEQEPPFVYRGFQMVDEARFRKLRGDQLRAMNRSGMLALIVAHLLSLPLMSELMRKQIAQGKGPRRDA
jgi:SapC